ncbi:carbohydrate ABC transporter permease [Paenibacillus sp. CGMCC 1.16610]|uniref:ABC transporter permease subunit n=1 Tax=Paenibacillus anseongense TaxID=2682845 RepID=A0ABW9U6D3_9BACL|nr:MULTISPECIES: carbohydrate ABC transporter permease [Paenibacillus]MBA2939010.1 carbohydrate ABC transporter permease [Paenibacillus sp. CGMCC 1.16610]MVQ34972.1 ABC transporter permease subunit [Paenibacillus anseongense]
MPSIIKYTGLYLIAAILLLFTGYPFIYMIATSVKTQELFFQNPTSLWSNFVFENYALVFKLGIDQYFINSILISVVSVFAVILLSAMVSFPLSRIRFKLNRPIYYVFLAGMMIPVHTTLIPVYLLTKEIGLYDSLWALLGPYISFSLPVSIIILTQFIQEIPRELDEAAIMDGTSQPALFWKIILPLLAPALATIGIYNFIHIWNEFVFGLVLITTPEKMTLPLGLRAFYGEFSVNIPGIMATLTLGTLPLLIAYFLSQEKVVRGLSAGAVKG